MRAVGRALIASALAITLVVGHPTQANAAAAPGHVALRSANPEAPPAKHPRLSSRLVALLALARTAGTEAALADAALAGIVVREGRLLLEVSSDRPAAAARAVGAVGGLLETKGEQQVEALVPVLALGALAEDTRVQFIRPASRPTSTAVAGEGVRTTGAGRWQTSGITGAGVKVAIVDVGFEGYEDRIAAGDLPADVEIVNECADFEGDDHGTAVAEIVHEVAPGATLYLACIETELDLAAAVDVLIDEGVDIINTSLGWVDSGRGDGSGGADTPQGIAAAATAAGVLWVSAAGNEARQHWGGQFLDRDGDGRHEFKGRVEANSFVAVAGVEHCVTLKWDDWDEVTQDFDLYLLWNGVEVAAAEDAQTGAPGQMPIEQICGTLSQNARIEVVIREFDATRSPRLDLFVESFDLAISVASGSINEPAAHPDVLAVGAVCWTGEKLEPFSSQGPTISGRIKPDVVAPDGVSTGSYGGFRRCGGGGFSGTSAAAPHVAGAAALVKQARPDLSRSEIHSVVEGRVTDLGKRGKDNLYGSGLLTLGGLLPNSISGVVTNSGGDPVGGVTVLAYATARRAAATTETAADGTYRLELSPGTYRLRYVPKQRTGLASEWWDGAASFAAATPLVLDADLDDISPVLAAR